MNVNACPAFDRLSPLISVLTCRIVMSAFSPEKRTFRMYVPEG